MPVTREDFENRKVYNTLMDAQSNAARHHRVSGDARMEADA
jgi:hypothetical protein